METQNGPEEFSVRDQILGWASFYMVADNMHAQLKDFDPMSLDSLVEVVADSVGVSEDETRHIIVSALGQFGSKSF